MMCITGSVVFLLERETPDKNGQYNPNLDCLLLVDGATLKNMHFTNTVKS